MYGLSAQLAGNQFVGVPLTDEFLLDEQAMLNAVNEHQPSLVFIAYPNNPTGACFDEDAIARLDATTRAVSQSDRDAHGFQDWTSGHSNWLSGC